jgi:hypothetical protein
MLTQKHFLLSLSLILFFLSAGQARGSVIDGPVLSLPERGWADCGLIIRAEADVTLLSVRFPNQGQGDLIELLRASDWTLLTSMPVAAGNRNAIVDINYPLTAHETYLLIATTPNNKYYGDPGVYFFPAGNSEITVLGSYFGSPYDGLWFTFNDITTQLTRIELNAGIDIKPGSDVNNINLKSKGVVPVAILSTEGFDISNVDVDSVKFAGASPVGSQFEDLDGDGIPDLLLLHFRTEELTDLSAGSTEAVLTGTTLEGIPFTGVDTVNIVPKK